jgi:hypothetical protein
VTVQVVPPPAAAVVVVVFAVVVVVFWMDFALAGVRNIGKNSLMQ